MHKGLSADAGLIAKNDELNDFIVVGREVECEHKRVREPTLVKQSIHMGGYDGIPVVLDGLDNLESQSRADDVASSPGRNRLAELIVMDRTTLGRNIQPLQRDGLIAVAQGTVDRRSKELYLTDFGLKRLSEAWTNWEKAQAGFDAAFGSAKDSKLRALMRAVTSTELVVAASI
jgi:DNA-binding MarR family transcriptional regulator